MLRLSLAGAAMALLLSHPSPSQTIHATSRYVYVLRGDMVHQLDAETLELKNSTRLPAGTGDVGDRVVRVNLEEIVEARESNESDSNESASNEPNNNEPKEPAKALERGIAWLVAHQDKDGHWDSDNFMKHDSAGAPTDGPGSAVNDVGVTGLALLALLGDGNTLRVGPHRDAVKQAVRWLRSQQDEASGRIGSNANVHFIYGHAIATRAIVEAYGLSEYKLLKSTAQRAINYLEQHRNPYAAWRYQPRDGDNDTSVTGWCVTAYLAAKDFDLEVNDNALKMALSWIDSTTDPKTGRVGYTKVGQRSSRRPGSFAKNFPPEATECPTAIALCCKTFMLKERDDLMARQADLLLATPPSPAPEARDYGYWFWGTYAQYQMGGTRWKTWEKSLQEAITDRQRQDGNFTGSWNPDGAWGDDGGRVYSTALACLTLQVAFRYQQLVR